MFDLTLFQIAILALSAFLVGFSKTSGTSLSSVVVPLMVEAFSAKEATGILCLTFFFASFRAVYHCRHYVQWHYFPRLGPGALLGLVCGAFFMQEAANDSIKLIIGMIILVMLGFNYLQLELASLTITANRMMTGLLSILIGFCAIVANAGAPLLAIYLISHKEDKLHFIGTMSVFFLLMDMVKIPMNIWVNVVDYRCLQLNLSLLPLIIMGGFCGIAFLQWISSQQFRRLIQWLSFLGALKLVFRPLVNFLK